MPHSTARLSYFLFIAKSAGLRQVQSSDASFIRHAQSLSHDDALIGDKIVDRHRWYSVVSIAKIKLHMQLADQWLWSCAPGIQELEM